MNDQADRLDSLQPQTGHTGSSPSIPTEVSLSRSGSTILTPDRPCTPAGGGGPISAMPHLEGSPGMTNAGRIMKSKITELLRFKVKVPKSNLNICSEQCPVSHHARCTHVTY